MNSKIVLLLKSDNYLRQLTKFLWVLMILGLGGLFLLESINTTLIARDSYPGLVRHLEKAIKADELYSTVKELSSIEYEGRLTGTNGYNKAASRAAGFFKKYGLLPIKKDYFQRFPISYTKVFESSLKVFLDNKKGKKEIIEGVYFKNFYPLNFSGSGNVSAEIVFAGLGITAPEYGYDDYRGIDAAGKIVLIVKGVPRPKAGQDWGKYNSHRYRTRNAKNHGAVGLLYTHHPRANCNGDYIKDFPMVIIPSGILDKILADNHLSFRKLWAKFDSQENSSYATGHRAHIRVKSENFQGEARNVLAYIPGIDPKLKDEFVVICAHLDHCGKWPRFTPGAHDNASGSAVVLAAARALSTAPFKSKRSLLFILFAAEEMGMEGSEYFVNHIPAPVRDITYVINMDMVGSGGGMFVMRLKNYPVMESTFYKAVKTLHLQTEVSGNKVQGNVYFSDFASFVEKGIPAISVYSSGGTLFSIHTEADTIQWIDSGIMEDIGKTVSLTAFMLANK